MNEVAANCCKFVVGRPSSLQAVEQQAFYSYATKKFCLIYCFTNIFHPEVYGRNKLYCYNSFLAHKYPTWNNTRLSVLPH